MARSGGINLQVKMFSYSQTPLYRHTLFMGTVITPPVFFSIKIIPLNTDTPVNANFLFLVLTLSLKTGFDCSCIKSIMRLKIVD